MPPQDRPVQTRSVEAARVHRGDLATVWSGTQDRLQRRAGSSLQFVNSVRYRVTCTILSFQIKSFHP